MDVCVITMQKDEKLLLKHFAAYYGDLFGYENIFIIDNGSSWETKRVLADLTETGCNIMYDFDQPEDFSSKGAIIGKIASELAQRYDAFITLDCDEFIGVKVDLERPVYSCDRGDLLSELAKFQPNTGYKILQRLRNDLKAPGRFYDIKALSPKLVFGPGSIENLCVGLHSCTTPECIASTNLVFFEFHNKPFSDLQRSAFEKLKTRVDVDDRQKLSDYRGPGEHLPKYLIWSESEYHRSFDAVESFFSSAVDDAFAKLGLPPLYQEMVSTSDEITELGSFNERDATEPSA